MGKQPSSNLVARQLAVLKAQVYASPTYLKKAGVPKKPEDLSRHECIGFPKADTWTLQRGRETATVKVAGRYVLNSVGMFRKLATLDQGLILLPRAAVVEDLEAGRLRQVLPEWHGKPQPVYAMTETRLLPAKTLRFVEFLQERLAALA